MNTKFFFKLADGKLTLLENEVSFSSFANKLLSILTGTIIPDTNDGGSDGGGGGGSLINHLAEWRVSFWGYLTDGWFQAEGNALDDASIKTITSTQVAGNVFLKFKTSSNGDPACILGYEESDYAYFRLNNNVLSLCDTTTQTSEITLNGDTEYGLMFTFNTDGTYTVIDENNTELLSGTLVNPIRISCGHATYYNWGRVPFDFVSSYYDVHSV